MVCPDVRWEKVRLSYVKYAKFFVNFKFGLPVIGCFGTLDLALRPRPEIFLTQRKKTVREKHFFCAAHVEVP